jgi:glycosyltransferase involved in cell wall biosynthesis
MRQKIKQPKDSILSVVIPAFNSEQWIIPTLEKLWASLGKTSWKKIEILVVDDGSTDSTAVMAKKANLGVPIRIIKQRNSGRLKTRKNGISKAVGDYIFFLDSRVYTQPGAFEYLVFQMQDNPEAVVWNGHIIVERKGNVFARFWYTVTYIAWRRYMKHPELTHYGLKDFDYYPKGAGCFFAPKYYLVEAYKKFSTVYKNDRNANDDTTLIRHIAEISDIYISPGFAFTYNSRSTWKSFIRHTLHRGVVFIDGYLHRGTRYFYPLIVYLLAVPVLFILAIFHPIILLIPVIAVVSSFLFVLFLGSRLDDAAAFAYVLPVFAIYYTFGLYKGVFMRNRN